MSTAVQLKGDHVTINETTQFNWSDHQHSFAKRTTGGSGCYSENYNIEVCTLCDAAARASDIPDREHFRHPKGCKCFMCVNCRCWQVRERDKE